MGADFTHQGGDDSAAYAFDVGEIHSVAALAFFGEIDGQGVFVLLFAAWLFPVFTTLDFSPRGGVLAW
jgi:hypothetical protein